MSPAYIIDGLDEFTRDMRKMSAVARSAMIMDALDQGAKIIAAYAQENIRNKLNKHPMGKMTNATGIKREGKYVLAGVFGVIYAKIHEFGGVIRPVKAKALKFQIDGKWIVTKKVTMPARPYLRPAVDEHQSEIRDAVIAALCGLLFRDTPVSSGKGFLVAPKKVRTVKPPKEVTTFGDSEHVYKREG
jgi:HK97 gp10 family phage protein